MPTISCYPSTMAAPEAKQAIAEAAAAYVKPEGKIFEYGTAGVSPNPDPKQLQRSMAGCHVEK